MKLGRRSESACSHSRRTNGECIDLVDQNSWKMSASLMSRWSLRDHPSPDRRRVSLRMYSSPSAPAYFLQCSTTQKSCLEYEAKILRYGRPRSTSCGSVF